MQNVPPGSANPPTDSTTVPVPSHEPIKLNEFCQAVAGGLIVRVAIPELYGSKSAYYNEVSIEDRLTIRRVTLEAAQAKYPGKVGKSRRQTLRFDADTLKAIYERTDQLSLKRGRVVSISQYIHNLIGADLSTAADEQL